MPAIPSPEPDIFARHALALLSADLIYNKVLRSAASHRGDFRLHQLRQEVGISLPGEQKILNGYLEFPALVRLRKTKSETTLVGITDGR